MNNQRDTNVTGPGTAAGSQAQNKATAEPVSSSASGKLGEQVGRGVRDVFSGIHGAGESLRGGLNAAVDKAFGSEAGVQKDDAIARRGEREMKAGRLTKDA
ncbi:7743999c-40b2-4b41-9829-ae2636671684 [Thermothielavioides terrestris]|uniref:Uncharacterized protein n=2 Tax=Thermothielavioides terrestris TaxID=2587410 RepID=G2REJ0_THETT|nr:uncharacterized protein THITE_156465 [Thermothielavioides terrestris NRRL 8126]AEO70965.1 hypothetical protein THITE_156465 [Thermothielavioides terrestris NRRL 8126]SPQ25040.1 7743999c-40b2-4b41-9829-ae2636671684 [Thermothielavioides terrestris]